MTLAKYSQVLMDSLLSRLRYSLSLPIQILSNLVLHLRVAMKYPQTLDSWQEAE